MDFVGNKKTCVIKELLRKSIFMVCRSEGNIVCDLEGAQVLGAILWHVLSVDNASPGCLGKPIVRPGDCGSTLPPFNTEGSGKGLV